MKNYLFPVYVMTAVLLIYVTMVSMELSTALILFVFSLSPLGMLWMVYRVLRAEVPVKHTFEERWYEDEQGQGPQVP
ncbi:MAG: hypothetical protein ACXIT9_05440 [Nitritalea sp.]